ncbi:bifunctional metallophosphatase/5'-nucleotidase [Chitinophagaceae bacterium LB-8]|uniref:Bifunctional metallophosphatase/5'-nucleotidase n=1 Tax=Paraflavisolibacter caeni TaxID=2982496 RepID=A0A9X2XMQ4_9BACT|nr:bifunctional metallophosphatase/5'-nucleotidase [Paraflavisolibacter caeni]MCU7547558.1 bifunctional metallophosphatase/5'-nucleotidase [Paraflavisolibacter caeni]
MKHILRFTCLVLLAGTASCSALRKAPAKDDGKIEVVFVQVNDVYEIAPLAGGREGGMARVATLKKQYQQRNPNTFLVMAGDFLSPSVYNSLQYEGKRIRGRQMVEAMNSAGTDLAIFGNHEFDISEVELQDRINESDFQWISSNAFHKQGNMVAPFAKTTASNQPPFPKTFIKEVKDKDGTTARIGFIGLVLPFNKASFVNYTDPLSTAKELYNSLKDSVDAVVALTHQFIADDRLLAKELPGLAVILGGHEHDMRLEKVGNVFITKAHANAKSAYVVKLDINKKKHKLNVDPKLVYINEKTAIDSSTNTVVQKWVDIAAKSYSLSGFDANKVVINSGKPLNGLESAVRSGNTNLTRIITAAMADAVPEAEVVIVNAGSIRVDDMLPPPVTQYDILRSLPFGGGIKQVDMKGSLLVKTLQQGKANKGIGGFLHYNETLAFNELNNTWTLNGNTVDTARTYRVALSDFLLTGGEANLGYLTPANPGLVKVYDAPASEPNVQTDIRLAIVRYLEKREK